MNAQDFIEHDAKKDRIERLRKEQIILDSKICALKHEYDTNAKVYSDLRKECTLWYDEKCFRPQHEFLIEVHDGVTHYLDKRYIPNDVLMSWK